MAKISPLMAAPPLLFLALATMFYVGMNRSNPNSLPSAIAGHPAPPMSLEVLGEGAQIEPDLLTADGVKLVNYWASWCAPCRAEHAQLERLENEGVPIYGVNYKDDPRKALAFLVELGDPYAALGADPSGRAALDWGVYGVPETYVIDGDGIIVLRFAGPITRSVLQNTIRPAIEAAK